MKTTVLVHEQRGVPKPARTNHEPKTQPGVSRIPETGREKYIPPSPRERASWMPDTTGNTQNGSRGGMLGVPLL